MSGRGPKTDRRQLLAGAGAVTLLATPLDVLAADVSRPIYGRGQPFDTGWRFHRGENDGLEAPSLDDSGWRAVDLPHDWSIEDLPAGAGEAGSRIIGPFDALSVGNTSTGFAVGGDGWYRKRFKLAPPPGGRVELLFEGVYMNSEVWLNGHRLGSHPYGYSPFAFDLTPHLAADGNNVLAVLVRNRGRNSRWYSGSGIYRHVWLDVLPSPARIARWGVGVSTRRIVDARADIEITTRLEDLEPGLRLETRIRDAAGKTVWRAVSPAAIEVRQNATIGTPRLWSPAQPNLYRVETELRRGAVVLDRSDDLLGIRIVTFDADHGMAINGVPTKLRGGCVHHDHGLLGAASFDAAEERKVRLLKARGYNALRGSHNPFSPAFLRACDRLGMLVVAEAFDMWGMAKEPQDYAGWFEAEWPRDLSAMVQSQRNHPSIILWSIGNEIPDRNLPQGVRTQWSLANTVHRLDPSRPVTAAINGFAGHLVTPSEKTARPGLAGVPDESSAVFLDVVGYNYKLADYEADHARFPKRILYGSESYPKDLFEIWELTDRSPWLLGDFVWTAMDYLGEAGIGGTVHVASKAEAGPPGWPWINAFCGDLDLIGNQKAASLARDVAWGLSDLEIAVRKPVPDGKIEVSSPWGWSDERPSWTWPGAEGRKLTVRIYSRGDHVELRLNGQSVATLAVKGKRAEFDVPYAPGLLEAIAFRGSRLIARRSLVTAGAPAAIRVTPEVGPRGAGRGDIHYVAIQIVDSEGRAAGDAVRKLTIQVNGPAELAAFGSAGPHAANSFKSGTARSWNGHALAILRGKGERGLVRVEVAGEGLSPGRAELWIG